MDLADNPIQTKRTSRLSLNFNRSQRGSSRVLPNLASLTPNKNYLLRTRNRPTASSATQKNSESVFKSPDNKLLRQAYSNLKKYDTCTACLSVLISLVALVQNEINHQVSSNFVLFLRVLIVVACLKGFFWLVKRYKCLLYINLLKYSEPDTLVSSGLYKGLVLEVLVFSLCPPPGLDSEFEVGMMDFNMTYSWDTFFTFLSLLKLYTLFRLFGHYSSYMQGKAERICESYGEKATSSFAAKASINLSPFKGIGAVFLGLLLVWGVCMRLAERPDRVYVSEKGYSVTIESQLGTYWDNFWLIFVTTSTVGYGDTHPVTHLGRTIGILSCLIGNMYLGMLIVGLQGKLEHNFAENLAYSRISRKHTLPKIHKKSKELVQTALELFFLKKQLNKPKFGKEYSKVSDCNTTTIEANSSEKLIKKKLELTKKVKEVKVLKNEMRNKARTQEDIIRGMQDYVNVDLEDIAFKTEVLVNQCRLLEMSDIISKARALQADLSEIHS